MNNTNDFIHFLPFFEKLKELTKKSRAVVRTGETTSYANVILVSGVTF